MAISQKLKKLTVVILTRNSGLFLRELLPTLTWVGEVLLIDDMSSDDTLSVAKQYGTRVIKRRLGNDWSKSRNDALLEVKTPWTMYIDADEKLSKDAELIIRKALARPGEIDGFLIKRVDLMADKTLEYGETGDIRLVRIGRTKLMNWERPVHEVWNINNVKPLPLTLYHRSHISIKDSLAKIKRYARLEADYRIETEQEYIWHTIFTYPTGKFLYSFILHKGFMDGWRGLYMSALMSIHSFLVRWFWLLSLLGQKPLAPIPRLLRLLMVMILLLYPLGHITRVTISNSIGIYAFEVLMAGMLLLWLIEVMSTGILRRGLKVISVSMIGCTLVFGISLLVNFKLLGGGIVLASLYWFRLLLYSTFMMMIIDGVKNGWINFNLHKVLIWLGYIIVSFGWLQYIFMPDMRWLYWYGWDDHYYRLIGTLLDPGFLALILVLHLVLLITGKSKNNLSIALVISGLVFTYARSGYLVFVLALLLTMFLYRQWKKPLLWLTFFLVQILLVSMFIQPGGEGVNLSRTYSVTHRARSIITAWDLFTEHRVFGVGYNAYSQYAVPETNLSIPYHPSSPDNSFLLVLSTTGLIGMGALIMTLGYWYIYYWQYPWVLISLTTVFIHAMTNNSLFYPWVLIWLALMFGSVEQMKESKRIQLGTF